jgi:hypothetical protein
MYIQSNLYYPNHDYPNPWLSELRMQWKCRVKVCVTTWPICACAVNLRCVVASWEPSIVLTLKEVKEMQGKCSPLNRGWDWNARFWFLHARSNLWAWSTLSELFAYPNSRFFHVAKGVPIIKVGLYYLYENSQCPLLLSRWGSRFGLRTNLIV